MITGEKQNKGLERGRDMVDDFILRSDDGIDKNHYRGLARYAALPLVLTVDLLTFLRQEFLPEAPAIVEVDLLLSNLCLEAGEDIYIMNRDARTYLISELRKEDDGLKKIERVNLSLLDHLDFLAKNHRSLKSREWETQKLSAMLCIFEKRDEAAKTIGRHLETLLNRLNQGSRDQSDESKNVQSELRWLSSLVSEMAENLSQYPELVNVAASIGRIMSARTPEEAESIRNEIGSDREFDLPGISKPIRIIDAIFGPTRRLDGDVEPAKVEANDRIPDVYIIAAPTDNDFVERVTGHLKRAGISVWSDGDGSVRKNGDFVERIRGRLKQALPVKKIDKGNEWKRALYSSGNVLFFCSPESFKSDELRKQFDLASRLKKPIYPLITRSSVIPGWLGKYQSMDLTEFGKNSVDDRISELIGLIIRERKNHKGFTELLPGGVELELVFIPGGDFLMGGRASDEQPQHSVRINSFYLGQTQVTQAQWQAVMGSLPNVGFKGNERPVERVSWEDVQKFCQRLSEQTGLEFRLPTEAEWEYAARAGTTTEYSFGDDEEMLGDYAWFDKNSRSSTHDVGQKIPNQFGLFDMHGNVWEWCEDYWHGNYKGAPSDGSAWLSGGDSTRRVVRGGSWYNFSYSCRSAIRVRNHPDDRDNYIGLRLVVGARTSGP